MRENLGGVVVRLGVFLAVCLLTAFLLIAVFGEVRFGDGKTYYAEFANVSNLRTGKLVRIAGVEVGKVTRICSGAFPRSRTTRIARPVICTAGCPRIRRLTCAAPATSPVKPCRASAHPP